MISESFELEFHEEYLTIRPSPNNKVDSKDAQFWEMLAEECKKNNCRRVLTEVKIFSDEMTYIEAYFVACLAAATVPTIRIACFVEGQISKDLTDFVELTASNRGAFIRFYSDRNEAIDWLRN